jgi:ABC-2 type transport system ATP-binding protein
MIHKPKVLILDEPTVGLDPNQIIKVREMITELGADHTVILSTHILPEVEQVCERVFIIDRGRIVADGSPEALRTRMVGNPAVEVELKGAGGDAREALGTLPGVADITDDGDGRFHVEHTKDTDPRESIFRLAMDKGWVLLTLSPEKASLEDVFVRLTTREDDTAASAAGGEEVRDE